VPTTLVTPKVNPDLDGTSCSLAYTSLLGDSTEGIITGIPQSEVNYFVQKHHISIPTRQDTQLGSWNKFVLVDASSMKGMPKVVKSDAVVEIIDHREGEPKKEFPIAKIQNDLIGAAATIVIERFIQADKQPSPDHAKLLYGAIFHNTLNLTSSNTTDRDLKAIAHLEKHYHFKRDLVSEMFEFTTSSVSQDVYTAVHQDAKEFEIYNQKIGFYQLIVWSFDPLLKPQVTKACAQVDQEMGCSWSLINIIDLSQKHCLIYSHQETGQRVLAQSLNLFFVNGWSVLKPVLLRKQISPLLKNVT
jgi:inorganic pyrophosphatase/exopolyphosphatase